MDSLIVLKVRSPKWVKSSSASLLEALEENPLPFSMHLLVASCLPWLVVPSSVFKTSRKTSSNLSSLCPPLPLSSSLSVTLPLPLSLTRTLLLHWIQLGHIYLDVWYQSILPQFDRVILKYNCKFKQIKLTLKFCKNNKRRGLSFPEMKTRWWWFSH